MNAIRIAALGAALVIGSAVVARAQSTPPTGGQQQNGPGRSARRNQQLTLKDISLSTEQQSKIEEINKKYAPEMLVIFDGMQGGGDRAEGMKKMADLRAKISPEIRAVLTVEQQAIYDKNMLEAKARIEAMAKQLPPSL